MFRFRNVRNFAQSPLSHDMVTVDGQRTKVNTQFVKVVVHSTGNPSIMRVPSPHNGQVVNQNTSWAGILNFFFCVCINEYKLCAFF